jgi:flagellar biosynthesis protein
MAEAQRQGIYVHDAPELVALLMQLDLDAEIPASLYQVVAELLVWVFELSENGISHRETLK